MLGIIILVVPGGEFRCLFFCWCVVGAGCVGVCVCGFLLLLGGGCRCVCGGCGCGWVGVFVGLCVGGE